MSTRITSFTRCISALEKKQRLSVYLISAVILLVVLFFIVSSMGVFLIFVLAGWLISWLTSEYNVRKIQAVGVTVSPRQLPEVYQALSDVCSQFGVVSHPRLIVVNQSSSNAFAVKFARKRVIVVFSQMLEGIIDQPEELRALLAHELCHCVLDHGMRSWFELYKPARFRQGRELTCDNAGFAASENLEACAVLMRKLSIGNNLAPRVSEPELIADGQYVESGLVGWFVRRHLSHPPVGVRIANLQQFAAEHPCFPLNAGKSDLSLNATVGVS